MTHRYVNNTFPPPKHAAEETPVWLELQHAVTGGYDITSEGCASMFAGSSSFASIKLN